MTRRRRQHAAEQVERLVVAVEACVQKVALHVLDEQALHRAVGVPVKLRRQDPQPVEGKQMKPSSRRRRTKASFSGSTRNA